MRDSFAIFVLSYGRPEVDTFRTLEAHGYTGESYVLVDDGDPTLPEYLERWGDRVLVFSKEEVSHLFDTGDLEPDRRASAYARHACWGFAREKGVRWFGIFDDDYTFFQYRMVGLQPEKSPRPDFYGWSLRKLDGIFEAFLTFLENTPTLTIAMAQGGDLIGGVSGSMAKLRLKRKAMNTFLCDTERPFSFVGRLNEDVSTYVWRGRMGDLFYTYSAIQLQQPYTQEKEGGISDVYRESGTYAKSFFSVMYAPSCVTIRTMGPVEKRLHHRVHWNNAVPKLIAETHRRTG